ncbi:hypothetical protein V6N13_108667 [Hibiscus sabdariffa]
MNRHDSNEVGKSIVNVVHNKVGPSLVKDGRTHKDVLLGNSGKANDVGSKNVPLIVSDNSGAKIPFVERFDDLLLIDIDDKEKTEFEDEHWIDEGKANGRSQFSLESTDRFCMGKTQYGDPKTLEDDIESLKFQEVNVVEGDTLSREDQKNTENAAG